MQVTLVRTVILYIAVVLILRLMGKRQIGQLQPSELVVAMMLSELATIPMENMGTPLLAGIVPIVTLFVAETSFSFLTLKCRRFRKVFSGSPTVLINRGKIMEKELERLRYNIDDLLEELRSGGYPNIADVEYAIIESNGDLSILPKAAKRPITPGDLSLSPDFEGVPYLLVSDGIVNELALEHSGRDMKWLMKQLDEQNIHAIENVFLASLDTDGNLFLQEKTSKHKQKKKENKP